MSITAYATYCEDIREEVDNQYSLIGCFKGHISVEEFPAIVPRICVAINWMQSLDEERLPVQIKLMYRHFDDDSIVVLGEHLFPIDTAPVEPGGEMIMAGAHYRLSLTIAKPGVFGVRLYRAGQEMRLRGLPFAPELRAPATDA